jgi:hypothetical protein
VGTVWTGKEVILLYATGAPIAFHASRPWACPAARQIMSRFITVCGMRSSVALAGHVGCPVHLVASRLAGCDWWSDRENDRWAPQPPDP